MKDMGQADYVLRVKISRDCSRRLLSFPKIEEEKRQMANVPYQTSLYASKVVLSDCWIYVTRHLDEAVVVYYDSTDAIAYARDPKYHGRTKYHSAGICGPKACLY
ncbi:hypothetical protein CsSME_00002346 [Camellia sinensis var. sinensis]